MTDPRTFQRAVRLLLTVAAVLAVVYQGRGIYLLGFSAVPPVDLRLRWRELIYVCRGQNPYDLSERLYREQAGLPVESALLEKAIVDPQLGATPIASGYPPWAFFWSLPFIVPVDWAVARWWFFALNIAAFVWIARFIFRVLPAAPLEQRWLLVAGTFSATSIANTFTNGQWGLVLCALLLVCLSPRWRGSRWGAGLVFAGTLLKPTVTFTAAAVLFRQRRYGALVIAGAATAAVAWLTAWWVGTGPVDMLRQMFEQSRRWQDISYSVPDGLIFLGLPRSAAFLGCLGLAVGLTWWCLRKGPDDLLFQLAVCGTLARLFTYHQLYDNVMVLFLGVALGRLWLQRGRGADGIMYVVVLVSLWLPGRLTHWHAIQVAQFIVWTVGLCWLLRRDTTVTGAPPTPQTP